MLGVFGINHTSASLEMREAVSAAIDALVHNTPFITATPHVFLKTCNRTELYYSCTDPADFHIDIIALLRQRLPEQWLHNIYSYFGINCSIHLHRVVAGLDSAFLGETEIQGQVRRAYESAVNNRQASSELHYLFQKGLHAGKCIRRQFPKQFVDMLQIDQMVLNTIEAASRVKPAFPILLIGASAINQRICQSLLKHFSNESIVIANRTADRGADFAKKFSIEHIPFSEALAQLDRFETHIFGAKLDTNDGYLCTQLMAQQFCNRRPLMIDLGMPRNIDPQVRSFVFELHNIDTLHPKQSLFSLQMMQQSRRLAQQLAIQYYGKYGERKRPEQSMDCEKYVDREWSQT